MAKAGDIHSLQQTTMCKQNRCLPMGHVTNRNRVEAQATIAGHVGGLLATVLMAGCAGLAKAPSTDPSQVNATQSAAAEVSVSPTPATSPATPPVSAVATEPKAAAPAAAPPAKSPANPATAKQPAKNALSAPAKPAAPPLDLKSLETRLKETKAIGLMTKLALKNQVDDLLDQFREHYQGQRKTSLAELRRPYELLLQKVLALLQDGDPPLAVAIVTSREAIWGILADPVKFAAI